MTVERREFLKLVGAGTLGTSLSFNSPVGESQNPSKVQRLHQDYQSNNDGTEYYFLGNGLILSAIQTSSNPDAGTHCGLLIMSPEHFGRKLSTYLYHPERGLQNSRCIINADGTSYLPEASKSQVSREYPDGVPTIVVEWQAGPCAIRETIMCPIGDPVLIRTVQLKNNSLQNVDASATVLLYPNLMYFDEYEVDRTRGMLTASGYKTLRMFSLNESTPGDRHLNVRFGSVPPAAHKVVTFVLTLDYPREEFERKGLERMKQESVEYWSKVASMESGHEGIDHLFKSSTCCLRAAVARSGKMDGGIWQYNLEWVRDESMVAAASAMCGHAELAESLLRRILSRSVDETGKTVDASRHRPPETIELDQNGELLYALYTHWVWTGNDAIIRDHWPKIKNVANYVRMPIFADPSIGLVKNTREFWERDGQFGVKEGYENAYQLWNIVGLEMASSMAREFGDLSSSKEWIDASRRMKESFLKHPRFSLVNEGRFIKRRLASGEVQRTFEPVNRKSIPPGTPMNVESISYCDPDSANVLPIALGIVEPKSPLAQNTLQSMEQLWNQRWDSGGYARYHVSSEPDSPGPWPFATMFIARAYLEAGDHDKVWRALKWLLSVQGGKAGAWLEYYGDRPTPPLPPVGIVVWTWAELVVFFVNHMLGVRPSTDNIIVRPRMLSGLDRLHANLGVRGRKLSIDVRRDPRNQWAFVDGKRIALEDGALTLPLPQKDMTVEIHV